MRWTHWVNFPVLTIMIWSGMLIYWANDIYSITLFGHTFVRFFPDWFYRTLGIPQRLAEGMAFHFLFMWFFMLNGLFYVLYTIISGEWRELVPKKNSFKEAWFVLLHDLHIRKTAPPQNKYNAAQRIAYTAIIIMGFGSVITGLAIYKPVQFYYLTWLCGGYHFARILHFALTIGYVFFFLVHVIQVAIAGWRNFWSVISGFEAENGTYKPFLSFIFSLKVWLTTVILSPAFALLIKWIGHFFGIDFKPGTYYAMLMTGLVDFIPAAIALWLFATLINHRAISAVKKKIYLSFVVVIAALLTAPAYGIIAIACTWFYKLKSDNGANAADGEGSKAEALVEKKIGRRNFVSISAYSVLAVGAFEGWRWLYKSPDETATITAGARAPLRKALNKTEIFFRRLAFSENHLVKTYPKEMAAKHVRVNSDIGVEANKKFDPSTWTLQVIKNGGEVLSISLQELMALPKTEIIYDFKCVEGWDQISHWAGVKFSDFIKDFGLDDYAKMQYVGMETPDKNYYVGLDMPSAMHPQTLLAYEVNDKLLPLEHGAPLRLIIPVKYGIKNLKRIGTISFSNTRPRDYWAEQGYDYYSGL